MVGEVTVIHVMLFVWDVSMLRECEGDGNAGVVNRGSVVSVSAVHESMGGTRDSGIVSSANDLLEMSVVRGMRGVGGVCEMCMARGGMRGEGWVEWVLLIRWSGGVCLCLGCGGVGGVGGNGWAAWVCWETGVVLRLCVGWV